MTRVMTTYIFSIFSVLFLSGCEDKQGNDSDNTPLAAQTEEPLQTETIEETSSTESETDSPAVAQGGETSASKTLEGFGALTGSLRIEAGGEFLPAANAKLEFESHPEYDLVVKEDGSFRMNNVVPGALTIYATFDSGLGLAEGASIKALQIKDIIIGAGSETIVPEEASILSDPGSISGTISLINNPENVELLGIEIYIPGTSYLAKADATGNFTISNVPAGTYDNIRFEKPGLTSSDILDIQVKSGENLNIGSVFMSLSTGPSGKIVSIENSTGRTIGGNPVAVVQGTAFRVNLLYDSRATLMKSAHESAFINVDWIPVASNYDFTAVSNATAFAHFKEDGVKNIFVKFSDSNGLESSVYNLQFITDNQAPTLDAVTILNGWAQSSTQDIFLDIEGSDAGSGIKDIMISNVASFSGATWQGYSSSRISSWNLENLSGANTVYVKVRDYEGRESNVVSDGINVAEHTLIHNASYNTKMTLLAAHSPYRISEDVTFESDLSIEPGTTFLIDSSRILKVLGVLTSKGTVENRVTFKFTTAAPHDCSMGSGSGGTINLESGAPGVSQANRIEYTDFVSINYIKLNGGLITQSKFDASLCTENSAGHITKSGLDNLTLSENTFIEWNTPLRVKEGDGNSKFLNNSGTMTYVVLQEDTASNTQVKGNTFSGYLAQYLEGGLIGFLNNNDIILENNTFEGTGVPIYVSRTADLLISNLTISGCSAIIKGNLSDAAAKVTIQDSEISNCDTAVNLENISLGSQGTFKLSNNNIEVSRALVTGGSSSPSVQVLDNNLSIECGTSNGTYCDLLYFGGANKINGGDGMCANERDAMGVTLTGNNISCFGNATSGCRGITLQMPPNNGVEQGTTGTTPCDFDTSRMALDLDGNFWSSAGGSKTLSNGTNLNTSTSIINYSQLAGDTMTIDASNIQRYEVNYPNADIIDYSGPGFPTVTTTTENASAGPR